MDRRVVAGGLFAVVLVAATLVSPAAVLGHLEALTADPLLFALAVTGLYLVRPFLAWPTSLCSLAVGYGLGVAGFPLAMAGVVVTALPPFFATRWVLGDGPAGGESAGGSLAWFAGPARRARELGERYFAATGDVRGVTAAKLAPIPADAVTCAAAASRVSLGGFVAGTLLGELPWTVAAVVVGASASAVTGGGLGSVGLPLAVGAGVAALALLAAPAYRVLGDAGAVASGD